MVENAYRDPRTGLFAIIADAEAARSERMKRVTRALLKALPRELRLRLKRLMKLAPPADDAAIGDLQRFADSRVALIEALDEAIAMAPALESALRNPASDALPLPHQEDRWGPTGTERAMVSLLAQAESACATLDAQTEVHRLGARIHARIVKSGVPLLWLVEFGSGIQANSGMEVNVRFLTTRHTLEMNLSPQLPDLTVTHEGIGEAFRKLFHSSHDIDQHHKAFDKAFVVEGVEVFARALLSPAVRVKLLGRQGHGNFELKLRKGLTTLSWKAPVYAQIKPAVLFASVDALLALRESASQIELVRGG